jgi:hypothetical protein
MLLEVALVILQQICFASTSDQGSEYERLFAETKEMILKVRTQEEIEEQEKVMLKLQAKIKTYYDLQVILGEEVGKYQANGEEPDHKMLEKLASSSEKLQKYQQMHGTLQLRENMHLQH